MRTRPLVLHGSHLAPFALVLLVMACTNKAPDVPTPGTDQAEIEKAREATLAMKFPRPFVTGTELRCAEKEFKKMVHIGNEVVHDSILASTIQFTVESYQAEKVRLAGSCSTDMGLVIHYGLDLGKKDLSFAYSFVCMDLHADSGACPIPETPLYILDSTSKFDPNGPYQDLTKWRQGAGKVFQDNVVVDKYDHGHFQYIYKHLFSHMVYKLAQIDALIDDNKLGGNDWIEIVPVAEPEVWSQLDRGANFSLRTCLVAKDNTGRLITDLPGSHGTGDFDDRGSDLGSACPPLCNGLVRFPEHGTGVRRSCKE